MPELPCSGKSRDLHVGGWNCDPRAVERAGLLLFEVRSAVVRTALGTRRERRGKVERMSWLSRNTLFSIRTTCLRRVHAWPMVLDSTHGNLPTGCVLQADHKIQSSGIHSTLQLCLNKVTLLQDFARPTADSYCATVWPMLDAIVKIMRVEKPLPCEHITRHGNPHLTSSTGHSCLHCGQSAKQNVPHTHEPRHKGQSSCQG